MRLKGFVLIEKEGKYLLIQEAAPKWDGKWFLPGGSIKTGETLEAGTLRELMEEAGCAAKLVSVFFVKRSAGFFNRKISVFFKADMIGENVKTKPDKESLNVRWCSYEDLLQLPLRQNLKKIIDVYRTHTDFLPVEKFTWRDGL